MRQNVWIWNHYATNMFFDQAGRHYWFAENLIKKGYKPTIFCANTRHNTDDVIDVENGKYSENVKNNIPFVFVKTPEYKGNGKSRILNMVSFYKNLFPIAKEYANKYGKPDVILASSVHPLTLVAGIRIAKRFGVPCICEVRDLWPESIVAYGSLKRNSVIAKILYLGEKWIYKNADKIIFTMEGGKDYISDRGWDIENGGPIDLGKVYHLNNGVDLESFNDNKKSYTTTDFQLDNTNIFKVLYTGSIRKVNDLDYLLEVAKQIDYLDSKEITFIIYGDGDDKDRLIKKCIKENITNVIFKGKVHKREIPNILSKADLNILHFQQNSIKKYGASLNKLFEYFASGKPIISDCEFGYDLINRYMCGFVRDNASPVELAKEIIKIRTLPNSEYKSICENSLRAAQRFSFVLLTKKLIEITEIDGGKVNE